MTHDELPDFLDDLARFGQRRHWIMARLVLALARRVKPILDDVEALLAFFGMVLAAGLAYLAGDKAMAFFNLQAGVLLSGAALLLREFWPRKARINA